MKSNLLEGLIEMNHGVGGDTAFNLGKRSFRSQRNHLDVTRTSKSVRVIAMKKKRMDA